MSAPKLCLLLLLLSASSVMHAAEFSRVSIITGEGAGSVESKCAALLRDRIAEVSAVEAAVAQQAEAAAQPGTMDILLGIPEHAGAIRALFDRDRIQPLGPLAPGPEGFLLKSFLADPRPVVMVAGVDERGVLYGVGELLRRMTFHEKSVEVPEDLEVRTAPAFEVRGTQNGQSHIAKSLGKVRDWTEAERQHAYMDEILAGANVFDVDAGPDFDFLKSWGLMANYNYGPNTGSGPPEWQAEESIGRGGYLCPSVPAARAHLLEMCEKEFSKGPDFDFVKLVGGDGGGCECDRCDPYGLTFIRLCEDMAGIIHKYHPKTRIWFTNQKFDDADDTAILKYLQEQPREWLWAWGYGPGSDGISWQPGHRQTHNMALFQYPGFGPFDRYNQYLMHELPPEQTLLHYNEITHWRYSQHGYVQMYPRADKNGDLPPWWNHFIYERRPDQALTMVYDRLTFFAWPRYFHWLFGEVNRYGVGDISHSSGHHDHFNQWMWQRLLWAPQMSVEEVVDEYCRTWFGPEAAPLMAQALFQLEENLGEDREHDITEKPGIDRYYDLVHQARKKMPANLMKGNWLWRAYMEKAAIDLHTKLAVEQQEALRARVEKRTARALNKKNPDRAIEQMLSWFPEEAIVPQAANPDAIEHPLAIDVKQTTPRMDALRAEALRLGEESNALFGWRNEGEFNLKHDFIGLGWLKRQLERARAAQDPAEKQELLRMIVAYEDPGPGGFYDNLGTFNPAPNVVHGSPYDHGQPYVFGMLDEGNRPSQRSMHSTQDDKQGVTLHYRGLDPKAKYKIRFTLVRPWFQPRYSEMHWQKKESIYADDIALVKDLELPFQMSDFFTYEIPQEATQDGELSIRLEKEAGIGEGSRVDVEQWRNSGGWGTLLSEAWLLRE